jgi:hypothetical protein
MPFKNRLAKIAKYNLEDADLPGGVALARNI